MFVGDKGSGLPTLFGGEYGGLRSENCISLIILRGDEVMFNIWKVCCQTISGGTNWKINTDLADWCVGF